MARGEFGNEIVPKVVLGATHVRPSSFLSPLTSVTSDPEQGPSLSTDRRAQDGPACRHAAVRSL